MTFQEKYTSLHRDVEKYGKEYEAALKKLTETDGFGDMNDVAEYNKAHKKLSSVELQFQRLLQFVQEGNIDPETEFIDQHFMYDYIKADQIKNGVQWNEHDLHPSSKVYSCKIGLTNNGETEKDFQYSIYKFPVLNLKHGKECYTYLNQKFQHTPDEDFDVESLDFSKVIDDSKPIFIKISMMAKSL